MDLAARLDALLRAAVLLTDPVEDHLAGVDHPPMTYRAMYRAHVLGARW